MQTSVKPGDHGSTRMQLLTILSGDVTQMQHGPGVTSSKALSVRGCVIEKMKVIRACTRTNKGWLSPLIKRYCTHCPAKFATLLFFV